MKIDLRQLLVSIVETLVKYLDRPVILIGGTGCVGKSSFSEDLADHFRSNHKLTVSVLDLDCYLIERDIREARPQVISGYNPAGYELSRAVCDIESLLNGNTIQVSPYDKETSRRIGEIEIKPADVLIVEGVMALTDCIRNFGSVRIFFDADAEVEYENRVVRENKLGFDRERTERKFALLMADHKKFITPQREFADIYVHVGSEYKFLKIELRERLNHL